MVLDHSDLQFVPSSVLDQLFCKDTVAKILANYKHTFTVDLPALQSFICDKAKKVFAILIWTNSEPLIEQFFQDGFVDDQLPVHLVIHYENEGSLVEAISERLGNIHIDKHPFNRDPWTDNHIEAFRDYNQWPFLSPVFEENQFRYKFHHRTRLPFVNEDPKSQKESFFSVVEEWQLHRSHIRAPTLIVRIQFNYLACMNRMVLLKDRSWITFCGY